MTTIGDTAEATFAAAWNEWHRERERYYGDSLGWVSLTGLYWLTDEFDTVAGLVMKQLGRLPRRGETLQLADCELKVMRFDRRRIDSLRLTAPREIVPPEDRPLADE